MADLLRYEIGESSRSNELSPIQDRDSITKGLDIIKNMGRKEDGSPFLFQVEDKVPDLASSNGIQPRQGFVQKDDPGMVDQGLCHADPLEHST